MADADPMSEFISQYVAELQDLTFNSKAIINTLTMLANENKHAASGVAEAVEKRILSCAATHKLPGLYLLDSIIKNVGLPYTALFARDLPEVYMSAWNALPDAHQSLQKLYNTWHRFFPADILSEISQRVSQPQAYQTEAQPMVSHPAGSNDFAPSHWAQSSAAYPSQHQASVWPNQYVQPPQQFNGQAPAYGQAPFQYMQQQQPVYAQQPGPSYSSAYTPTYPQAQYPGNMPGHISPGHQQTQHISPSYAVQGGHSPAYQSSVPAQQPGNTSQGIPDFLAQLIGAGLIPAGKGAPPTAGAQPGQNGALPPTSFENIKSKDFAIKAVEQLMEGTDATRAKFLDLRLHKQRKRAAGGSFSRQWFVKESDWLAGTTADAQAVPAFFDEPHQEPPAEGPEGEASVLADPNQPNCAISGEQFESVWDDATNGWRYAGATALNAQQAEQYGLPEGSLVKISCLGPPGGLGLEEAADVLQEAEAREAAHEVEAAAAEENRSPTEQADIKPTGLNSGQKHEMDATEELREAKRRKS